MTQRKHDISIVRGERQVLRYTLLFLVTAVCTYALFIVLPRTFLSNAEGNIDGIAQQYPIYIEIKRMIHALLSGQGWESWSWDIGLGDDAFIEFSTKLFNPLTYIVIAFPQRYLDIGFTLMVLVSQYLSGLSFMLLGNKAGLGCRQNITGGICYAFSGWVIQSILRQGTFLMASILFPLLVYGAEKLIRCESPLPFIAAVAAHVLYSMQWTYIGGISIVIYYAIRMITMDPETRPAAGRTTALFVCSGLAGIAIPGIVLIDTLTKMISATTSSSVESRALYTIAEYLAMPTGFFRTTPVTEAYTVLGMPSVCVMLLPAALFSTARGRKSRGASDGQGVTAQRAMAAGLLLLSLLPVTGRVFNGLSYSVGRWYYVLAFFMVWAAMDQYRPETFRDRRTVRAMARWLIFLAVWGVGVCRFLLNIIDNAEALSVFIGVFTGLTLLLVLAGGGLEESGSRAKHGLLIAAVIVISIVGYVNTNLFPGLGEQIHTLCQVGRIEADLADSTQRVGPELQAEDTDFYRIDQVDGYTDARIARVRANENMYWGNRSVYTYLSTMESKWHDFCRATGNSAGYFDRTTVYSNDNREGLDLLTGVKYFLGDSDTKKPGASEYAGYGFEPAGEIDGVEILRNKHCIGLGAAFSSYITESELMEYTPLEREQVMLQAAVIPDADAGLVQSVRHADSVTTDVRAVEVKLEDFKRVETRETGDGSGHVMVVRNRKGKGGSFSMVLPEIENARIMLAFEGFVRGKSDMDQDIELRCRSFNGNALSHAVKAASYTDNEKFKIEAERGNVVKAAQMRKGKNQGYSDVEDYYINLGYYDKISGKVRISIDRAGVYTYDAIRVYAVPVDIYEEAASELEAAALDVISFSGREVTGTARAAEDSVMYCSILDQPGWTVYVDGEEISRLSRTHIAFMGFVLPAGEHEIRMEYRTPYVTQGICLTLLGLAAAALIAYAAGSIRIRQKTGNGTDKKTSEQNE